MDFLKLCTERCSVRKFTSQAVEKEKLELILEAGRVAPTACNNQPQKTLVLQGEDAMRLWEENTVFRFGQTLVLLTCYDKTLCWKRSFDGKTSGDVDGAIVMTHMMLEAASLGIGSVWLMHLDPDALRRAFSIPESYELVGALAMGYAAEDYAPSPLHARKKPLAETVFFDRF